MKIDSDQLTRVACTAVDEDEGDVQACRPTGKPCGQELLARQIRVHIAFALSFALATAVLWWVWLVYGNGR